MKLTINIDTDGHYDDPNHTGWRHLLILDPEDGTIETSSMVGAGCPAHVWHNRAISWSIPACTGEALNDWAEEHVEQFAALADCYEGAQWDGSNWRGSWTDEAERLDQDIQDALGQAELACRWDAGDYMHPTKSDFIEQARKALAAGDSLEDVVESIVDDAACDDVVVDSGDVHALLLEWLEEDDERLESEREHHQRINQEEAS